MTLSTTPSAPTFPERTPAHATPPVLPDEDFLRPSLLAGILAMVAATLLAAGVGFLQSRLAGSPERAILATGAAYAGILAVVLGVATGGRWRSLDWQRLVLVALVCIAVELVATYFFWTWSIIRFRADILLWPESEFVGDIIKLGQGYPLYTAPANLESFTYAPGTQTITYVIAALLGKTASIPVLRAIQVGFTVLAAVMAFLCSRTLIRLTSRESTPHPILFGALWLPLLFLISTNLTTNQFVQFLHNDALSLLVSITAYWLLLEYVRTRSGRILTLMALIPAIGFLAKQSLLVWVVLYGGFLLLFDTPRSWSRIVRFGVVSAAAVGAVIGGCYLIWGGNFTYWVFTVMGNHQVSPLRSLQHVLAAWAFFAVGIGGGLLVLGRTPDRGLAGAWLVGLALLTIEAYTSGVAWMTNHMGPGCLIAGVWLAATMARHLPAIVPQEPADILSPIALRAAAAVAFLALLLGGLGSLRIPEPGVPPDTFRYVAAIEKEFEGLPPDRVLLDMGSWLYLPHGLVMKDRGAPAGEAGYTGTANFTGLLDRIRTKHYDRILVRDLHGPGFNYDYAQWARSSGVRAALLENYHETSTIPAVDARGRQPPWFAAISVLAPNR